MSLTPSRLGSRSFASRRRKEKVKRRSRRPALEFLETRRLLASDWRNPVLPADIDNSGAVTIHDLLTLAVNLRTHGVPYDLSHPYPGPQQAPYLDADGDGQGAIGDLLQVMTVLRSGGAESEAISAGSNATTSTALDATTSTGLDETTENRLEGLLRGTTANEVTDGFEVFLGGLQDSLEAAFAPLTSLPLIGGQIGDAVQPFFDVLTDARTGLSNAINQMYATGAVDPDADLVELFQTGLFNVLEPVLQDGPDSGGAVNVTDIQVTFGIDEDNNGDPIEDTEWATWSVHLGQRLHVDLPFELGLSIANTPLASVFPNFGFRVDANDGVRFEMAWDLEFGFGLSVPDGFFLIDTGGEPELRATAAVYSAPPKDAFGNDLPSTEPGLSAQVSLGLVQGVFEDGTISLPRLTATGQVPQFSAADVLSSKNYSGDFELIIDDATGTHSFTINYDSPSSGENFATFLLGLNARINTVLVNSGIYTSSFLPVSVTADFSEVGFGLEPGAPKLIVNARDLSITGLTVVGGGEYGFEEGGVAGDRQFDDGRVQAVGFSNGQTSIPNNGTHVLLADSEAPANGQLIDDVEFALFVGNRRVEIAVRAALQEEISGLDEGDVSLRDILADTIAEALDQADFDPDFLDVEVQGGSLKLTSHPGLDPASAQAPSLSVAFDELEKTKLELLVGLDIVDPDDEGRLTFTEIGESDLTEVFVPIVQGDAQVRVHVASDADVLTDFVEQTLGLGAGSLELPGIEFDFKVDASASVEKNDAGELEASLGVDSLMFDNVLLDIGSLLDNIIKPVANVFGETLGPVFDVIGSGANAADGFLNEPIPVLSDILDEDTSIADLGSLNGLTAFFEGVAQIAQLASNISDFLAAYDGDPISFGCFSRDEVTGHFLPCEIGNAVGSFEGISLDDFLQTASSITQDAGGFSLDILSLDSVLNMLLGNPFDIVSFDLPAAEIDLSADLGFNFDVLEFGIGASANLSLQKVGLVYDSTGLAGIVDAFRSGATPNFADLLDGFYISSHKTLPELDLELSFNGSGEVGPVRERICDPTGILGCATITVVHLAGEADVSASASFDLQDPDGDGELRLDEILELTDGFNNPEKLVCLFDAEVAAEGFFDFEGTLMNVSVSASDLGIPLHIDASLSLSDIIGGAVSCPAIPPPILATETTVDGRSVLRLNAGPYADARLHADTDDSDGADFSVSGQSGNVTVTFRDGAATYTQTFTGQYDRILAVGGIGNDRFDLSQVSGIPVELHGNDGADTLKGGNRADKLFGDGGSDDLDGGAGDDELLGGRDNDHLQGGAGSDLLHGEAGDDTLLGGDNNDQLFGGDGRDTGDAGPGSDLVYGGRGDELGLSGGDGDDQVFGESGNDFVSGGAGNDVVYGGDGNDSVDGGTGTDTVYGGLGNDSVGGGADDVPDFAYGESGSDTVVGGLNDSVLDGGYGSDSFSFADGHASTQLIGTLADYVVTARRQFGSNAQMYLTSIENRVSVSLGSGNDQFTVASTVLPATILGGGGDDTITVREAAAAVTVDGQGNTATGFDTLAIDKTQHVNGLTGELDKNTITGLHRVTGLAFAAGVEHRNAERLTVNLGDQADRVTVRTIGTDTTFHGGGGDDEIVVHNLGAATLDPEDAPPAVFHGGGGEDTLTIVVAGLTPPTHLAKLTPGTSVERLRFTNTDNSVPMHWTFNTGLVELFKVESRHPLVLAESPILTFDTLGAEGTAIQAGPAQNSLTAADETPNPQNVTISVGSIEIVEGVDVLNPVPLANVTGFDRILDRQGGGAPFAISPSGDFAYASIGNGLSVLRRDPASDELITVQFLEDNQNGVDGVHGVTDVALAGLVQEPAFPPRLIAPGISDGDTTRSPVTADVDGDGDMDVLAILDSRGQFPLVVWYENDGDGGFIAKHEIVSEGSFASILAMDKDADRDVDLLVGGGELRWYTNDGDGDFTADPSRILPTIGEFTSLAAADLDGDGDLDVAAVETGSGAELLWYENLGALGYDAGAPVFQPTSSFFAGLTVFTADLDGDQTIDLVSASGSNELMIYEYDGAGGFVAQEIKDEEDSSLRTIDATASDLDGDGDLDLVFLREIPTSATYVHWARNDGPEGFVFQPSPLNTGDVFHIANVVAEDLEGDGDVDIVFGAGRLDQSGFIGGPVFWMENQGDMQFAPQQEIATNQLTHSLAVADMDGDDDLDVLVAGDRFDFIPDSPTLLAWYRTGPSADAETAQQHVYVASRFDRAVAVFKRDQENGGLTFVQKVQVPLNLLQNDPDAFPETIAVSPDGRQVYTVQRAFGRETLAAFNRNLVTGELTLANTVQLDRLNAEGKLVVSPDSQNVYFVALEWGGSGAIDILYRQDWVTGSLVQLPSVTTTFQSDIHFTSLAITPDGQFAYAASMNSSTASNPILLYSRSANGSLRFPTLLQQHAFDLTMHPDGQFLIASTRNSIGLEAYAIDPSSGELDSAGHIDAGASESTAFSSDGQLLYLSPASVWSVEVTEGPPLSVDFTEVAHQPVETQRISVTELSSLTASPDGLNLYALSPEQNALVTLNAATLQSVHILNDGFGPSEPIPSEPPFGDIGLVPGPIVEGLSGARSLALSDDGKLVLVASPDDNAISIFRRDLVVGELEFVTAIRDGQTLGNATVDGLAGASDVLFARSISGPVVYVAGRDDNAIAVFEPDESLAGGLRFVGKVPVGADLAGPSGLAKAPNLGLYVISELSNSLGVFSTVAALPSLVQTFRNGEAGVSGLDNPTSVRTVGSNVYVGGANDTIAVFGATPDGFQKFLHSVRNGSDGVRGLGGLASLTVSFNHVFAVGAEEDSLVVFLRDPQTGALTFAQRLRNRAGGVGDNLDRPTSVTLSQNGQRVIVARGPDSLGRAAITTFGFLDPTTVAPRTYHIEYENVQDVTLTTAGKTDEVVLRDVSNGVHLTLNTGDGADRVNLVKTGDNQPTVVNLDQGDDVLAVQRIGATSATVVDAGEGDDLIRVIGSGLFSPLTVDGGQPVAAPGDTLLFDPGGRAPSKTSLATPADSVFVTGRSPVGYQNIETARILASPIPNPGNAYSVFEGGDSLVLTASAQIPFGGSATFRWDVNGDGDFEDLPAQTASQGQTLSFPVTWADLQELGLDDNGVYLMTLRVTDTAPESGEATVVLTINNARPTLTLDGAASVDEGQPFTLNLSASDPGDDEIRQWNVNWGDGTSEIVLSNPDSVTHTYAVDGDDAITYTITATATDEDGEHVAGDTHPVTVNDVPPTVRTLSGAASANEGADYQLTLSATGPEAGNIVSWTVNWGDGTTPQTANGAAPTLTHSFDGPASYNITAFATDAQGVVHAADNARSVAVANVSPTLSLSPDGATTFDEGIDFTVKLSAQDFAFDTIASWTINWGDGIVETIAGNPASVQHAYADGPHAYEISAVARDEDGVYAAGNTVSVNVENTKPTLTLTGDASVAEGSIYTLGLSADDPGDDRIASWKITWGDGSLFDNGGTTLDPFQVVRGDVTSATHVYQNGPNMYTVLAEATDEDGVYSAIPKTIQVTDAPPAPTVTPPEGLVIEENPFNSFEGSSLTFALDDGDPGTDPIDRWEINWGDGSMFDNGGTTLDPFQVIQGNPTSFMYTYADQGVYTIKAKVFQNSNSYTAAPVTVTILDVAPKLTVSGASEVDEGAVYTLDLGEAFDPGDDAVTRYFVNWGDSEEWDTFTAPGPVSHVYKDNPRRTSDPNDPRGPDEHMITIALEDEEGVYLRVAVHSVTVNNADPSIRFTNIVSTEENGWATLTGEIVDPGELDTHTVEVKWGDGSQSQATVDPVNRTFTAMHQYLDDGPAPSPGESYDYSITATVTDNDGGSSSATTTATVYNVDPVIPAATLVLSPTVIAENGTVTLTGSFTDVGTLDTHSVQVNWGDGQTSPAIVNQTDRTFTATHRYLDDPPEAGGSSQFAIGVTVQDDDGGSASADTAVTVTNEQPVITAADLSLVETMLDENGVATLNGKFTDVGALDTHTVEIAWGDGSTSQATVYPATRTFTATHQYLDDGPNPGTDPSFNYTITATVTDDDGGSTSADTTLTVTNVDPVISPADLALSAAAIDENGSVTLTGSFTDIGGLDTHEVVVNWGDGNSSPAVLGPNGYTFLATHRYLDDPAGAPTNSYTISVTVTDDDSGVGEASTSIVVNNLDPTITGLETTLAAPGSSVTLSASFEDVGVLDTHTAMIDWGDGSTAGSAGQVTEANGSGTVSGSHVYANAGIYTVTLTVTDDDGGSAVQATTAMMVGVALNNGVLQIVGTTGGNRVAVNTQGPSTLKVTAGFVAGGAVSFPLAGIQQIAAVLGNGDDTFQIGGSVLIPAIVLGGEGNDTLEGGGGPAALVGGDGDDRLVGGSGADVLIGGRGGDTLTGKAGDDMLIAGRTTYDAHLEALDAIQREWSSGRTYPVRLANLSGAGAGVRENLNYFLKSGVTVFDDSQRDTLKGESGRDWFFANSAVDAFSDRTLNEDLTELLSQN